MCKICTRCFYTVLLCTQAASDHLTGSHEKLEAGKETMYSALLDENRLGGLVEPTRPVFSFKKTTSCQLLDVAFHEQYLFRSSPVMLEHNQRSRCSDK